MILWWAWSRSLNMWMRGMSFMKTWNSFKILYLCLIKLKHGSVISKYCWTLKIWYTKLMLSVVLKLLNSLKDRIWWSKLPRTFIRQPELLVRGLMIWPKILRKIMERLLFDWRIRLYFIKRLTCVYCNLQLGFSSKKRLLMSK